MTTTMNLLLFCLILAASLVISTTDADAQAKSTCYLESALQPGSASSLLRRGSGKGLEPVCKSGEPFRRKRRSQRCMRLVGGWIEGCIQPVGNWGGEQKLLGEPIGRPRLAWGQPDPRLGQELDGMRDVCRVVKSKSGTGNRKGVLHAVVAAVGAVLFSPGGGEKSLLTPLRVWPNALLLAGLSSLPVTLGSEDLLRKVEPVAPSVSIQPPFLDWQEVYICEPATISVEILNTSEDSELKLFSVSTDNQQFFPSAFKELAVPPGESVNVSLTFLPVQSGSADATLLVQSSAGGFLIQMHGWGVPSHLKAAPVTKRILLGKTFTHSLVLHNPYSDLLRVTEVFTSDDFLQLHLPQKGGKSPAQGAAGLWEVAPGESKPVIGIEFQSPGAGKHAGLVHVAYGTVNGSVEGTLVIPVEADVVQGGLFAHASEFDFGTLTVQGERRELPLVVTNLGETPVDVFDVFVEPGDDGVSVSGFDWQTGVVVEPGAEQVIARVSFSGGGSKPGERDPPWASGLVVVNSNASVGAGAHIDIPYWARSVYGSLGYDEANTSFLVSADDYGTAENKAWRGRTILQEIHMTNNFPVPVAFYSAAVPGDHNFELVWLSSGLVAAPGALGPRVTLTFRPTQPDLDYSTSLLVATNVTTLRVPIRIHRGQLEFFTVPRGRRALAGVGAEEIAVGRKVDFGVVPPGLPQQQVFTLVNPTPEPIHIIAVAHPAPRTLLHVAAPEPAARYLDGLPETLRGLGFLWEHAGGRENFRDADPATLPDNRTFVGPVTDVRFTIPSGYLAIAALLVTAPETEGPFSDEVVFRTGENRQLAVPFSCEVIKGGLRVTTEPADIRAYPGRIQEAVIVAENTFDRELLISSLASTDVGFLPSAYRQYLQVGVPTEIGLVDIDLEQATGTYLAGVRYRKWRRKAGCKGVNCRAVTPGQLEGYLEEVKVLAGVATSMWGPQVSALLTLTTDLVKDYPIPINVTPIVPSLVPGEDGDSGAYKAGDVVYEFTKIQVGTVAYEAIDVANPFDEPIEIEVVLGVREPPRKGRSEGEEESTYLDGKLVECGMEVTAGGGALFSFQPDAIVHAVLAPREEKLLGPIALRPTKRGVASHASLFLHNNVTLLEELELIAQGGAGSLEFFAASTPLKEVRLELNGSYLGFERVRDGRGWALPPGGKMTWPPVTSQTVIARNTGDVRLEVLSLQLGSAKGCKGLGFSVSPCRPFGLAPGEARELSFSYRPDFAAATRRHELKAVTSAGDVSLLLVGRVPKQLLPLCLESAPRWSVPAAVLWAAGTASCVAGLACGALWWWKLRAAKPPVEPARVRKETGASKNTAREKVPGELVSRPQGTGSFPRVPSGGALAAPNGLSKSALQQSIQDEKGGVDAAQPGSPQTEEESEEGWIEIAAVRSQDKKKGLGKVRKGAEAARVVETVNVPERMVEPQKTGGKVAGRPDGPAAKPKKGARSQVAPEPLSESVSEAPQALGLDSEPLAAEPPPPSPIATAPGRKKKKKAQPDAAKPEPTPQNGDQTPPPGTTMSPSSSPLHRAALGGGPRTPVALGRGTGTEKGAHLRKASQGSENADGPHSPVAARTRPHRTDVITVDSTTGVVKQSVKLRTVKDSNGMMRRRNSGGHERTSSATSSGRSSPAGSGNYAGILDDVDGPGRGWSDRESPLHPLAGSSPQHPVTRPGYPPASPPYPLRKSQPPITTLPASGSPPNRSLYKMPSFVDIPNDSVVERPPGETAAQPGVWNRSRTMPPERSSRDPFAPLDTIGSRSLNPGRRSSPQANTYDIWGNNFVPVGGAPHGFPGLDESLSPSGGDPDRDGDLSSLFAQSAFGANPIRGPGSQPPGFSRAHGYPDSSPGDSLRSLPAVSNPFSSAFPGFSVFASQAPPAPNASPSDSLWSRAPAASAANVPFGALSQVARAAPTNTFPDAPSTIFGRSNLANTPSAADPVAHFRESAPSLYANSPLNRAPFGKQELKENHEPRVSFGRGAGSGVDYRGSAYGSPPERFSAFSAYSKPFEPSTGSVFGARAGISGSLWSQDEMEPPILSPNMNSPRRPGLDAEDFFRVAPGREASGGSFEAGRSRPEVPGGLVGRIEYSPEGRGHKLEKLE